MEKQYFFLKLIPPRPSFPGDITDAERSLMQCHVQYWTSLFDKGIVVVFGPVFDPDGSWGMGVVEADNAGDVNDLTLSDPVISTGTGFTYNVYPMKAGMVRSRQM